MKRAAISIIGVALLTGAAISCSAQPKTAAEQAALSSEVVAALDRFRAADTGLQGQLDGSAGYAILPNVGKAGLGVGGAYGRGEVYAGGARIGHCDLSQGTIGLQAGAQTYHELIIFKDANALDRFKTSGLAFAANASAVAIKPGAAAAAVYKDGVTTLVQSTGGLMAELSIGGQKLRYRPL